MSYLFSPTNIGREGNWIAFSPAYGTIDVGQEKIITATFDPSDLVEDTMYTAQLGVNSNDPDESTIEIVLTLNTLTEGTEGLSGFVKDAENKQINTYAKIQIYESDTLFTYITTNSNGYFSLYGIPSGTYNFRVTARGFYPTFDRGIIVPRSTALLFKLGKIRTINPTPDVVDFYSGNSLLNDSPIQAGDVITAFDKDKVLCGLFYIDSAGKYGLMHVYGDDNTTPDIDEGASEGDTLEFFINGYPAQTSTVPIWTGVVNEVDLTAWSHDKIDLNSGYNLISFTSISNDTTIADLLTTISGNFTFVQGFDLEWGGARTYIDSLAGQGFNDLTEMDPVHGYWIYMTANDELIIDGQKLPYDTPLPLEHGWNLTSYLPEFSDSVDMALGSIDGLYSVVNGFDEGALTFVPGSQFNDLHKLENGFGYWIKTTEAAILNYYYQSPQDNGSVRIPGILTKSEISPTPYWNDFYGLLSVNDKLISAGSEIRIVDPDDVNCGKYVISNEGQYGIIHVYGDDPATSAIDEGAVDGDLLRIFIDSTEVRLYGEKQFIWQSGQMITRLDFDLVTDLEGNLSDGLPTTYELYQNYPNPFNATTTIKYQLPKSNTVKIVIYNILGQQQKVLVNTELDAGYYSVTWNGDNNYGNGVASGVYFCRMESETFVKTTKIVLIK